MHRTTRITQRRKPLRSPPNAGAKPRRAPCGCYAGHLANATIRDVRLDKAQAAHDAGKWIAPLEVREHLPMRDASDPAGEAELFGPLERAECLEVLGRIPQAEAAPSYQAVGGGEAGVALDELELAVARIAFELGIGQPAQAHVPKQPQGDV